MKQSLNTWINRRLEEYHWNLFLSIPLFLCLFPFVSPSLSLHSSFFLSINNSCLPLDFTFCWAAPCRWSWCLNAPCLKYPQSLCPLSLRVYMIISKKALLTSPQVMCLPEFGHCMRVTRSLTNFWSWAHPCVREETSLI